MWIPGSHRVYFSWINDSIPWAMLRDIRAAQARPVRSAIYPYRTGDVASLQALVRSRIPEIGARPPVYRTGRLDMGG